MLPPEGKIMATDYLQALNIGSGIDTKSMVTAMVNAEKAPKQSSIDRQKEDVEAKISGMGQLKASLAALKTAFEKLDDKNDFNFSALSNSKPTDVYADYTGATVTPGTYRVKVNQLATNEIQKSTEFTSNTADLNSGQAASIGIQIGTGATHTLSFNAGEVSLTNLEKKINALGIGVTANIVPMGNGKSTILLQGPYGKANDFTITDSSSIFGFSQLQSAKNAKLQVNGLAVERGANEVSDLIPGLKLDLMKQTSEDVVLSVNRDITLAQASIKGLVDAFNSFEKVASNLVTAENDEGDPGVLKSDSAVRDIRQKIKSILSGTSSAPGTTYKTMSDIGISVQRDGTFKVDETKLSKALSTNFDDLTKMFSGNTNNQSMYNNIDPRGIAGDIVKQIDTYLGYGGIVQAREASYKVTQTKLQDDQDDLDDKMSEVEVRYTKKFSTMNKIMDEMKAMQDYLEGQLENLPFNHKD